MRLHIAAVAGAGALALAACTKPPLTDQQKTAMADSVKQYVEGPFVSTMEKGNADSIVALYAPAQNILVLDFGAIHAGQDAVGMLRAFCQRFRSSRWAIDSQHVTFLNRDAVAYTAMVTGSLKDSTGAETRTRFVWEGVFVRVGGAWKLQVDHSSWPPAPAPTATAKPVRARR
jgi:ketosteroid isomerase-like protein